MARPARRSGNLPAEATSFVGRRRELAELRKKLAAARLVSVVGPGGVGKTRFAIRMATDLGRAFRDGAWLVELAAVQDPRLVGNAVVAALGLRDQAATEPLAVLRSYLRDRELLLLLDSCEHVLGAAARLATDVLGAAPGVRVLTTSREPLSVSGEHVVPLPPLDLPPPHDAEPLARLRQNEAVVLFTERAAAASGAFALTAANRAAVVALCRRLDGLPLAIELAAVRTRVLSAEQIVARLDDRFGLLTGGSRAALPRQQTLRTTLEWSHELLAAGERTLLRRLCVFAGRFTLDDVASVCGDDDEGRTADDLGPPPPAPTAPSALDLLSSLVDKSLVTREDADGLACFRLHETMREYARLKLREAGEEDVVERRHARYYEARCQQSAGRARYRLVEWLAWMDLEIDNVRSVLRRCLVHADAPRGIGLASALGWFWIVRANTEGARWLDELLALGRGEPAAPAWAYFIRGFLAVLQGDPAAAKPALERAVAAAREAGQRHPLAQSLSMASIAETMVGDRAAARHLLDEADVVTRGLDDPAATVALLQARAFNGFLEGDLDAVRSASATGARLSREMGDLYSLTYMLLNQGLAALMAGDRDDSQPLFAEALRTAHRIDDRVAQCYVLAGLSCRAAASGEARLAAQLLGAAESARAEVGASVNRLVAPLLAQATASAAAALGRARFDAEYVAGSRCGRDGAIGLALGEPAAPATETKAPGVGGSRDRTGPLALREADVARLVADGLSNKQIGTRLFISERTVESHVRSILNKLGFNSRAQIAAWVASSDR